MSESYAKKSKIVQLCNRAEKYENRTVVKRLVSVGFLPFVLLYSYFLYLIRKKNKKI